MTVTIQTKRNNYYLRTIGVAVFSILGFVIFSSLCYVAYLHGDDSAFSSGYEFGSMLRGFVEITAIKNGLGLGSLIAVMASWERNKSIRWAILHAIFGWTYVIYFAFTRTAK